MRSRCSGSGAVTESRAKEGSSLVLPTLNSRISNSPPSSTIRANARRRMSESMRWPSIVTVSWTMGISGLQLGEREDLLGLVLPLLVRVRDLAHLVALEEEDLGDALVGVDLRGQRRGVGDLEGDDALPLRLEGRDVHDDPAARVGRFPDTDRHHVARDAEILDRAGQGERVRRDHADVALEVDEGARVEALGVN